MFPKGSPFSIDVVSRDKISSQEIFSLILRIVTMQGMSPKRSQSIQ